MSKISDWIGDALFDAAQRIVGKLGAFGRKLTPTQQRDQLERWQLNHIPLLATGACVTCGKPNALDTEHCPGPPKVSK